MMSRLIQDLVETEASVFLTSFSSCSHVVGAHLGRGVIAVL